MTRKTDITDAAIATLAADGLHGLTHRTVDRAARLPQGSTSYYFRTRDALLAAVVERLTEQDEVEVPALPTPDLDALAVVAATRLHQWMTVDRDRQLARYELALEASRKPALREVLVRGRVRVRHAVAQLLVQAGVPEPEAKANELAALLDGLLFDYFAGMSGDEVPDVAGLTARIRRLLRAVVDEDDQRADVSGSAGTSPPPAPRRPPRARNRR